MGVRLPLLLALCHRSFLTSQLLTGQNFLPLFFKKTKPELSLGGRDAAGPRAGQAPPEGPRFLMLSLCGALSLKCAVQGAGKERGVWF